MKSINEWLKRYNLSSEQDDIMKEDAEKQGDTLANKTINKILQDRRKTKK